MNGEAISEILGEMTGETVVNAKGIFEPEKNKESKPIFKGYFGKYKFGRVFKKHGQ